MTAATVRPRQSAAQAAESARILVIHAPEGDDTPYQGQLDINRFHIEAVTFGIRATKRLEEGRFDLLLVDGSTTTTKARNLLAKVRKTHPSAELPVIVITPEGDSAEMIYVLENGANDCVAAPVNRPVLAARMCVQLAAKDAYCSLQKPKRDNHRAEDWMQLVMDSATTAIFETGPDGIITRTNVAAGFLTERDNGDLIGTRLGSLFVDESNQDVSSLLARVAADGYFVSNHPARLRTDLGEERMLSLSLRRIGDDGQANGVVATAEDVTERWRSANPPEATPKPGPTGDVSDSVLAEANAATVPSGSSADADTKLDGRCSVRHRVYKAASLSFNNDGSVMNCIVRDMSDSGARLEFESYFDCPRLSRLHMSDGRSFDCEVRWFTNKIMGVSFLTRITSDT